MNFTTYLQQKQLSKSTVDSYSTYIEKFLSWLQAEGVSNETFIYNDLLAFMQHCQASGKTKRTVHMILCIVRHYCNYLIVEKKRNDTPPLVFLSKDW